MGFKKTYMMSGSKSGQIIVPGKPMVQLTETYLLSSSKSMQLIKPSPVLIKNPDSVNAALFPRKKKTN